MDLFKKIYASSPEPLQNLMISVQGFLNNHKRIDLGLCRRLVDELMKSQWWTPEQFLEFQNERLRRHLRYAADNIPHYKRMFQRLGLDPSTISSVDDLSKLPILRKSEIREDPASFLAGGKADPGWNEFFTSGTTGTPMNLWSSRQSFTRIWSFVYRLRRWGGLEDPFFPRRAQFTGRDIIPAAAIARGDVFWRRNFPGNALLLSTTHISAETVPAYVQAIRKFNPELIDGYPSAILMVARVSKMLGLELPKPKAIVTSAETLPDDHKQEIEQAFGCAVFNQYASSDTAAFACSCEHGRMHVNPEFGVVEVLDSQDKPCLPGQEGRIVATSFCNQEQVFIRYDIGDTATPSTETSCPCGRRMPMLEAVTGRVDDIIYVPDRGYVGRLDPVFKGLSNIIEAQIIQESLSLLQVKLVPASGYDPSIEHALIANLRKKVGDAISIRIEKTQEIPRGPNGKFRSVMTVCRDQYPA
jgi:phenylacetate-CoA ligase